MRVVATGLTTLDVQQRVPRLPRTNEKLTADELHLDFGGPAANAAATAGHLGAQVTLVTVLGSGPVGRLLSELLGQAGLAVVDGADAGDAPPVSTVLVEPSGDRAVLSVNAGAAPHATLTPEAAAELVAGAAACLVDGHHAVLCQRVAEAARTHGVPVLLDGGSWKPGLPALLPYVDLALLSADFRPPGGSPAGVCRAAGVRHVGISHGPDPVELWLDGRPESVDVPAVETVVDTLGAGDVLHGALLHALALTGAGGWDADTVRTGCVSAVELAARSTAHPGARGWIRAEQQAW